MNQRSLSLPALAAVIGSAQRSSATQQAPRLGVLLIDECECAAGAPRESIACQRAPPFRPERARRPAGASQLHRLEAIATVAIAAVSLVANAIVAANWCFARKAELLAQSSARLHEVRWRANGDADERVKGVCSAAGAPRRTPGTCAARVAASAITTCGTAAASGIGLSGSGSASRRSRGRSRSRSPPGRSATRRRSPRSGRARSGRTRAARR